MSEPDLFVVCKNCSSEVSPYVTECPYCGQRVRKRAPKLERAGDDEPPTAKRRRRPSLPRLRADEIAGIAPETRPVATIALVSIALLATLVLATGELSDQALGGILLPGDDQGWRYLAAPFVHADSLGYLFITMLAAALFGTQLERRFGHVVPVVVFLAAGAAGCALAVLADISPLLEDLPLTPISGANGASLGLLCAWLVDDRRAARRGDDRGNDLIGVYVFAAVLMLLSLAVVEANLVAAVGGATTGAGLGLLLPYLKRR